MRGQKIKEKGLERAKITQQRWFQRPENILRIFYYFGCEILRTGVQLLPVWLLLLVGLNVVNYHFDVLDYAENIYVFVLIYCCQNLWRNSGEGDNMTGGRAKLCINIILILVSIIGYVLIALRDLINTNKGIYVNETTEFVVSLIAIAVLIATDLICYIIDVKKEKEGEDVCADF